MSGFHILCILVVGLACLYFAKIRPDRKKKKMMGVGMRCFNCDTKITDVNVTFCPTCGSDIKDGMCCTECGRIINDANVAFCPGCGCKIDDEVHKKVFMYANKMKTRTRKLKVVFTIILIAAGVVIIAIPIADHSNIVRREASFLIQGTRYPYPSEYIIIDAVLNLHSNRDSVDAFLQGVDDGHFALWNEDEQKIRMGREILGLADLLTISIWESHREDLEQQLPGLVLLAYLPFAIPSLFCFLGSAVLLISAKKPRLKKE